MGTSDRLSMQMLETEPHFAVIPRTLSPIQIPRSSFDRLADYVSRSSDSGVGPDYNGRPASVDQPRSCSDTRLPVKHVTQSGTQFGTLLLRYLVHSHSKCITCKDCGIFFTYDSFLCHSHDKHGRKRHRPQADYLQLDLQNPDKNQMRVWEDSLTKMGQKTSSVISMSKLESLDGVSRLNEQIPELLNVHSSSGVKPDNLPNSENNGSLSSMDFDRNIRETVDASERLLRETSQYLHSSVEKMRHRRQRSLKNHQLRPKSLLTDDLNGEDASGSSSDHVQPVIKDANATRSNSKRPNRKFLEKYLEKSRDSFQLLTESLTSKTNPLKMDSSGTPDNQHQPNTLSLIDQDIPVEKGMVKEGVLGGRGGGGDAEGFGSRNHSPPRPVSPGSKSILLQEHFDRNDPLFIVQTAQELLNLAAVKMQDKPQKYTCGIDWQRKFEVERELNKDKDRRIKELEGLLQEEQRKRQEAEVQLRAIRLQNL